MPDLFDPVGPPAEDEDSPPVAARLFWFAALAAGSLIAVAGAAYLLRALLFMG